MAARLRGRALVAQWIEQEPSNLLVAGSIPAGGAHYLSLWPFVKVLEDEVGSGRGNSGVI